MMCVYVYVWPWLSEMALIGIGVKARSERLRTDLERERVRMNERPIERWMDDALISAATEQQNDPKFMASSKENNHYFAIMAWGTIENCAYE